MSTNTTAADIMTTGIEVDDTELDQEVLGELVDGEVLDELHRKASVYDDLVEQEKEVGRLNQEWADKKDEAGEAKKLYEAAVRELRRLIRAQGEHLPLFDGPVENESWRPVLLDDLDITPASLKLLTEGGLSTVGELADWTAGGKSLEDVKGIGNARAESILDALDQFWAANPAADADRYGTETKGADDDAQA